MKRVSTALIGIHLILVATNTALTASYSFTYFDHPNARLPGGTVPYGINNAGAIVGQYYDSNSVIHSFVLNGTSYSPVDFPGANSGYTHAQGINDAGTIVGWFTFPNSQVQAHGFTLSGGIYQYFYNHPEYWNVMPYSINNAGSIVGQYSYGSSFPGFSLIGGNWTSFEFPGTARFGQYYGIVARGINDAGTVVGYYNDANLTMHGFTLNGGPYTSIDYPGATYTHFYGINNAGTIIGWAGGKGGFVLNGTTYTFMRCPGGSQTYPYGINNAGMIVGTCNDAQGVQHAFLATPNTGDPDGIDWSMPDHLVAGKQFNANSNTYNGLVGHDYIYPPNGWPVNLFLTKNKLPVGTADSDPLVEWRWFVTPTANVSITPAPGGRTTMTVNELGTYNVTAMKYTRATTADQFTFPANGVQISQTVLARDFLIVGLGDSNGSGEGNPPWIFGKCDRSQDSYQFKSALYVEQQDPHSSVTFIFPACSGARLEHLNLFPYKGIQPDTYGHLSPQIAQVADLLQVTGAPGEPQSPRNADAVIISAGINNLYFGALMKFCVLQGLMGNTACQEIPARLAPKTGDNIGVGDMIYVADSTSKTTVADLLAGLLNNQNPPNGFTYLYSLLNDYLIKPVSAGGLGATANHVIITQYPDFTRDATGARCDTTSNTFTDVPKWGTSTWAWLGAEANILNSTVTKAATDHGWQVATLDQGLFGTHGYCAGGFVLAPYPWYPFLDTAPLFGKSYFLGIFGGVANNNLDGGFHPLRSGHGITANAVQPLICNSLFGNSTCEGPPTQ